MLKMPDEPNKVVRRFIQHFTTPPPVYQADEANQKHLHTPKRSAILGILHFCDVLRIPCSFDDIQRVLNIPPSTARDVVRSREPRTLKHSDAPDARGRPRQLTGADAHAIVDYLDHCEFEKKAETWQDIQIEAGVVAAHGKEAYHRTTIWRRVQEVAALTEHIAAQEEDHSPALQRDISPQAVLIISTVDKTSLPWL